MNAYYYYYYYYIICLHPLVEGRFPGCEWHPLPGRSDQSPKPGRWWWSLDCWGGPEPYGAADHTDSEEEEHQKQVQNLQWFKTNFTNCHKQMCLIKVSYRTVAEISHAGVSQQLPKHAGSRLLPRLQHLHCLVTEKEEEKVWFSLL